MTSEQNAPLRTSDLAANDNVPPAADRAEPAAGPPPAQPPPSAVAQAEDGSTDASAARGEQVAQPSDQSSVSPGTPPSVAAEAGGAAPDQTALLADSEAAGYRSRWETAQIRFVDEPRAAVEQADALVAEVMQHLAGRFAEERGRLEAQWTSGDEVGTEQLRQALQHYRGFFERLLER